MLLGLARGREDRALEAARAGAGERAEIADARKVADEVITHEYAAADAAIFEERSQRRRAIIQLLALERDETDRMLSSERDISERMLAVRDDTLGVVSHDIRDWSPTTKDSHRSDSGTVKEIDSEASGTTSMLLTWGSRASMHDADRA